MNLGAVIVLLKLFEDSGIVSPKRAVTPPTGEQGVRPACGSGEKAVFFQNPDRWVCVPKFN